MKTGRQKKIIVTQAINQSEVLQRFNFNRFLQKKKKFIYVFENFSFIETQKLKQSTKNDK